MNGQFEQAIEKAEKAIAEKGYEAADVKDVLWAGFGFLGDKIEKASTGAIRIRIEANKKSVALAASFGAGIASAVIKVFGL